ncbi:MAG: T9SS type A sorting domain-containing protein [Bacteroidota bacterium]
MKRSQYFLVFFLFITPLSSFAQDFSQVKYGPETRQFLDIYIAPSNCPTPVYFDAHGNGGTINMPNAIISDLKAAGISVVAWESLTSVNTPGEVETGWNDAELMFAWVKANASTYNFDTTNFIIGGSSRGSILSWKYGHSGDPNIKGLYMYNALPNGVWADSSWWHAPDEVQTSSPDIFFVYKWEPNVVGDSHDPVNGMKIMDRYDALGIGDRDTLIHSIGYTNNTDKYQFLIDFALSVLTPCQITSSLPTELDAIKVYPNPFQDKLTIRGLQGNERFTLISTQGKVFQQGDQPDVLNLTELSPGLYFLAIQSKDRTRTLKLIKQ